MLKYVNMLNERLDQLKDVDLIDNRTNTELEKSVHVEPKVEEDAKMKATRENLNKKSERKRKRRPNETIVRKCKSGFVAKAKAKHVNMLNERLEQLRDVDLIDNRSNAVLEISVDAEPKLEKKEKMKATHENLNKKSEIKRLPRKYVRTYVRKWFKSGYVSKAFVENEDEILRRAIREGKDGDIMTLAKTLNRDYASVRDRIVKLKTGVSTRVHKSFTLEEDQVILDAALEHFQQVQSIKETNLLNLREISDRLKRNTKSVRYRWENMLKVWLLGYYSKTLNLDVRIMLGNILADNFDSVSTIDWEQVSHYKEFSGHTDRSLRMLFFSNLAASASLNLNVVKSQLTLRQVAEFAEVHYRGDNVMKVPQNVQTRQMQIIEYFEKIKAM